MSRGVRVAILLLTAAAFPGHALGQEPPGLILSPSTVTLEAPEAAEQLLVTVIAEGERRDATRQAVYESSPAGIVSISPSGRVTPISDGRTEIRIRMGGQLGRVTVAVTGMASAPPVSFRRQVIPILSKAGCNSGGCHGKAEGQNGFKLSVFGNDVAADHMAIVSEGRGRRVFPAAPNVSLMLLKATGDVPHGGGRRMERGSRWHSLLRRWIAEGAKLDAQIDEKPDAALADSIIGISVEPAEVTLAARGAQQLRVVTIDKGGRRRCVTVEAEYQSNNDGIAIADRDGLVTATEAPGEAAILVRHLGHVAVCRVTRPRASGEFARPAERNFIDRHVWNKLQLLRVAPSEPADDATFLRRAFIDTIGTLPTSDEARRFLADAAPDKRSRLIAALLERPEYADYWAQRWADLLRVDKDTITSQGAVAMTRWLRGQFAQNVPYDQFVRTILTAQGPTLSESPAAFFQVQADPERLARSVSQLFLGVRIECAQCHHHPMERWDQADYFALAGFFTGVERKQAPGGGLKIVGKAGSDLTHPRSRKPVPTAGLGAAPASFDSTGDRRRVLADWVTTPQNPFFARMIVNRLWAHYFGRGLVEPIDDLRATNPASNEPLFDALAEHLIALKFDIKAFTRTLLESQAYQLSAQPNETNLLDEQNYSRAAWKPMAAEVLLDAISQATGVPEKFNGWPQGYRAIQVWDNKLPSDFLEVFGRPRRHTVCACERGSEPSMAQAMHLMNAIGTTQKIASHTGRAAALAASKLKADEIVDELYLATLSRFPSEAERKLMTQTITDSSDRREAVEDVLWTLINVKEFVFNH